MKHILLILFTLLSISVFSQVVRLDSTVIHESRDIYNQAGYFIGSDSFHVKRVRLVRNCVDTNYERTDTLIDRRPMLFITMDSVTLGSGITQSDADDRYLNENIIDTATVKKYFFKDSALDYTTTIDGQSIYMSQTTVSQDLNISALTGINISSTDRDVNFDNNDISIEDISDGSSVAIKPNEINLDRNATSPTITDIDVLTQGEIKALINDSLDLAVTNVTDGTTLDFTKTGRYLTGEVQLNSIDSTYLKPNSVKGSELEDVGTAGNYNNVTTDANGRVTSGSLLAYQTGTQVRDSIGILDADHDGDADDAELLQGSNGSYYRNRANHTGVQDTSTITALDEFVEDRMGGKIGAGTNITIGYTDGSGVTTINAAAANLTLTGSSPYKLESSTGTDVMFKAGTNITLSESNDTLTIAASGGGTTDLSITGSASPYTIASSTGTDVQVQTVTNGGIKISEPSSDVLQIEAKIKEANEALLMSTDNHIAFFSSGNNISTVLQLGIVMSVTGTHTASTLSSTNLHQSSKRTEVLVTTPATNAIASWRQPTPNYWFGNAAGLGGFTFKVTWGPCTGVSTSTMRGFCGMISGTATPTDVDPSTLTNMFGMGWDDDDTNVKFMHNDGSGTATKVDLGSSFPVPTVDRTDVYLLEMYVEPNTTTVYYKVTDLTDGDTASGSVNTDIPSNTTFLGLRLQTSAGGTSSVNGISFMRGIIMSKY